LQILTCEPGPDAKPRQEIIVPKGLNRDESSEMEEVAISPGKKEMLSSLRVDSSSSLEGEGVLIVEGRKRTVIFVEGGAREEREVRIAVPSSPAPRTRMLELKGVIFDDMVELIMALNKMISERFWVFIVGRWRF
jgi:hypothetical protein